MKTPTKKQIAWTADVVAVESLPDENTLLTLAAPEIAASAEPGQFVNVDCGQLLKRPLGIASVDRGRGTIQLGVKTVGKGTKTLSGVAAGGRLSLLGPLGRGFDFDAVSHAVLVGGGTGVYPLLFAAERLRERGVVVTTILGFRSADLVLLEARFRRASNRLIVASEQGGKDVEGTALKALAEEQALTGGTAVRLFACGPNGLLAAVASFCAENGIAAQVSLETRMGCGFGICRCCPVPLNDGEPSAAPADYARCCVEGPVFDAADIVWEAL